MISDNINRAIEKHLYTSQKLIDVAVGFEDKLNRNLNESEALMLFAIRSIVMDVAAAESKVAAALVTEHATCS